MAEQLQDFPAIVTFEGSIIPLDDIVRVIESLDQGAPVTTDEEAK